MKRKIGIALILALVMIFSSVNALAITVDVGVTEVKIPVIIDLTYSVAGVELSFEYTSGLQFVSYEAASSLQGATELPDVVENGRTIVGFYGSDNRFAPQGGQLNIGTLVFSYTGNDAQTVTVVETGIIKLLDKDTTERETRKTPIAITVNRPSTTEPGTPDPDTPGGGGGSLGGGGGGNNTDTDAIIITDDEVALGAMMPFTDVKEGDWFYDSVKYVFDNSLMNGVSDTLFAPDANLTRAMLVTILYRLEGSPTVTTSASFTDVPGGQWYSDAIAWAETNEIVNGYGDGRFGTNDNITREQFAVIMYNYAVKKGHDTSAAADLAAYTDEGSISSWALNAMKWANAEGLITGRTATTLSPGGTATRAEAATILMRFVEDFMK